LPGGHGGPLYDKIENRATRRIGHPSSVAVLLRRVDRADHANGWAASVRSLLDLTTKGKENRKKDALDPCWATGILKA
jgi:hypothetical protein